MDLEINKLEKMYTKEIKTILEGLNKKDFSDSNEEGHPKLGDKISDFFQITDFREYNNYSKILDQIEEYDTGLAEKLEVYIGKEINLIALLSLHVAIEKLNISK